MKIGGRAKAMQESRKRRWKAIEREFDEPLADVIIGMRQQGNTWMTIAGILGCNYKTLIRWRKTLGLAVCRFDQFHDPDFKPTTSKRVQKRVETSGYRTLKNAIVGLRFYEHQSIAETGKLLGICPDYVSQRTPEEIKGCIIVLSEMEVKARRTLAEKMRQSINNTKHPWRAQDHALFSGLSKGANDGTIRSK